MERTHHNGELSLANVNKKVTLVGWVSKKRNLGNIAFIDLRDRSGICQIFFDSSFEKEISKIKNEYVLQVVGVVRKRKDPNPNLKTGEIEVVASSLNIVNTSEQTPFIIADDTDGLEDLRLKYRYLDLRRPIMQERLMVRHNITKSVRNYFDSLGFVEVETPLLIKTTPEGARDYLVPSRVNPGKFYALPQSPQLFKQLLMIGGLEKYYQIARCFRDEDLRSDRQPDFTQIDIEMSFVSEEQIMEVIEGMYVKLLKDVKNYDLKVPLRRLKFVDAMNKYGSDKPDTRYGFEIEDVTKILRNSKSTLLSSINESKEATFKVILLKKMADKFTRKDLDALTEVAKKNGAKFLSWGKMNENLEGSLAKLLSEKEAKELVKKLNIEKDDIVFLSGAQKWENACKIMGAVRKDLARRFVKLEKDTFDLLWIVDFPLFEYDEEKGIFASRHHPFTRPYDEDVKYLETDPGRVRAHHYDVVMNGYELGSGSLRIYDPKMQRKVFEILGYSEKEIENKFSYFINAFKYGTPPHGGIAFGLDRIAMILNNTDSIRDVIAFPKNASAICPMSDAPTYVSEEQLKELHLKIID